MTGRHLLVFSPLRWDLVYQRPQHRLSRPAGREPVYDAAAPAHLQVEHPWARAVVLRPHTPVAARGLHDDHGRCRPVLPAVAGAR